MKPIIRISTVFTYYRAEIILDGDIVFLRDGFPTPEHAASRCYNVELGDHPDVYSLGNVEFEIHGCVGEEAHQYIRLDDVPSTPVMGDISLKASVNVSIARMNK